MVRLFLDSLHMWYNYTCVYVYIYILDKYFVDEYKSLNCECSLNNRKGLISITINLYKTKNVLLI